jgi:putative ABC transport system permease protein
MLPQTVDLERWRERSHEIEHITGHRSDYVDLITDSGAQRTGAAMIRPGVLDLAGRLPMLGRDFTPEEYEAEGTSATLLSHAIWQNRYGGDPGILGRKIRIDDGERVVVGVLPPGPALPMAEAELLFPFPMTLEQRTDRSSGEFLMGLGTLRPGATLATARTELLSLMQELELEQPGGMDGWVPEVTPLPEMVVGKTKRPLVLLFGAVLAVVLIACANVVSLLLARGQKRQQEIAVRTALGATKGRLVQQLMTENFVLAAVGGTLGVLLSFVLVRLMVGLSPADLPRIDQVGLDLRVLGFALLLTLTTGLVFGLLPALRSASAKLGGSRIVGGGPGRLALQEVLVVGQVALALVLLVSAGLLVASLRHLLMVEPGFETQRVMVTGVDVPQYRYAEQPEQIDLVRDIVERVSALPGIESATATSWAPLTGSWSQTGIEVVGQEKSEGEDQFAHSWLVSPGYFRTLGLPLLRGRDFEPADLETFDGDRAGDDDDATLNAESRAEQRPGVAIINQQMADRFWPDQEPIGQSFGLAGGTPWQVIGVAANVQAVALEEPPKIGYYVPYGALDNAVSHFELIVKADRRDLDLNETLRRTLAGIDPELPVGESSTLSAIVETQLARPRFQLSILAALSVLALVLAVVGLYGVVSASTSRRIREIGLRVALGASRQQIVRQIGGRGLILIVLGIVTGVGGALATTRLLESLLFEVTPTEPITFLLVTSLVFIVTVVAVLIPTGRASRVDPMEVLRSE